MSFRLEYMPERTNVITPAIIVLSPGGAMREPTPSRTTQPWTTFHVPIPSFEPFWALPGNDCDS